MTYIHCISIHFPANWSKSTRSIYIEKFHRQPNCCCITRTICNWVNCVHYTFYILYDSTSLSLVLSRLSSHDCSNILQNDWNAIWRWMEQMYLRTWLIIAMKLCQIFEIKVIINVSSWSRCQFWVTLSKCEFHVHVCQSDPQRRTDTETCKGRG